MSQNYSLKVLGVVIVGVHSCSWQHLLAMELESAGAPLAAEMVVAADEMEVDLELLVNLEIFE